MYYQLLVFRPREVPHVLVMSRQCGSALGQMLGDKKTIITAPVSQVTVSQYWSHTDILVTDIVTTVRVVTSVTQPKLKQSQTIIMH